MWRPLSNIRPFGPFIRFARDDRSDEEKLVDEIDDIGAAMGMEEEAIDNAKEIALSYSEDSSLSDDNYIDSSVGLNTIPLMSIYVAQLEHRASGNGEKDTADTATLIESVRDGLEV